MPTHHELLDVKEELRIARRGERILERRRDGLVFVLLDLLERLETLHDQLDAEFEAAVRLHTLGAVREGDIALRDLAMARARRPELLLTETNLLGLAVPFVLSTHVSTRVEGRGYGLLGTSLLDDEIAGAYESVLESVVRLAELRAVVFRLLAEVHRLRVRVNYLTHRLIPEREAERRYIELYLAEREREERFRQLWAKRRNEERADGRSTDHPES